MVKTLTISDRIMLQTGLPTRGNLLTMQVARRILDSTQFAPEEIRDAKIIQKDGQLSWNIAYNGTIDVDFQEYEVEIVKSFIAGIIETADKLKEVSMELLLLQAKF